MVWSGWVVEGVVGLLEVEEEDEEVETVCAEPVEACESRRVALRSAICSDSGKGLRGTIGVRLTLQVYGKRMDAKRSTRRLACEVRFGNAEDTLDTVQVSYDNLDVIFGAECRAGIEIRCLDEDAFDGVERRPSIFGLNAVQIVDDGAVKIMAETVETVPRHRQACLIGYPFQFVIRRFQLIETDGRREIQAIAKINDGTQDSRFRDS